ncbi:MAG: sugar transferase [Bacteroidales bacterium]|nr:sugar transferase [Bacteroidales bacterium]MCF8390638.1 sugar transferase [Bacteroidales bacterium]
MISRSLTNKLTSIYLGNKAEGRKRYLFMLELLFIAFAYLLSVEIWSKFFNPDVKVSSEYIILGLIYMISWALILKLTIVAKVPRTQRYRNILFNFVRISFVQLIVVLMAKYLLDFAHVSAKFVMFSAFINLVVIVNVRLILFKIFKKYRASGYDLRKAIIFANAFSDEFIERITSEKEWGFQIVKIVSNSRLIREKYGDSIPVVPESTDIKKILDEEIVDEIIYSKSSINQKQIHDLVEVCNEIGVIFRLQSHFSPLETLKLQLNALNNSSQLTLTDTPENSISLFLKYLSDLYFSFFIMLFLSPLFLLIGIIIKLDSKGPVFFRQERVGLRGRKFILFKFRTMVEDAEARLENLKDKNEVDGPVFKMKKDPRVTRFGKFLRKTGLDELPQFYNVLIGEMSLVGPRPPLASEVEQYERWQLRRLSVKPGITCTWQILQNRNKVNFESWMKMDLQYIDTWTFGKDLKVFFKTIKTLFTAS